tara:strand:- start:330 stop:533 length:204 start_codon:yes stop_codon:yes gene_type:complete
MYRGDNGFPIDAPAQETFGVLAHTPLKFSLPRAGLEEALFNVGPNAESASSSVKNGYPRFVISIKQT